jgi:hypothetical protein
VENLAERRLCLFAAKAGLVIPAGSRTEVLAEADDPDERQLDGAGCPIRKGMEEVSRCPIR